jgi:hypothetical protein
MQLPGSALNDRCIIAINKSHMTSLSIPRCVNLAEQDRRALRRGFFCLDVLVGNRYRLECVLPKISVVDMSLVYPMSEEVSIENRAPLRMNRFERLSQVHNLPIEIDLVMASSEMS